MSDAAKKSDGIFSMIKLGLTLASYAVIACTVLAVVNNITSPVIKANDIKKANEAMKAVFPDADSFELASPLCGTGKSGKTKIDSVNIAKRNGEVLGAVSQITGPTYERSTIMVGMTLDGKISGMRYLNNTDTPGFGQKGSDPTYKVKSGESFFGQFTGKDVAQGFAAGETFDAISGATITSNGIAVLMQDACAVMTECLSNQKTGE